MSTLWHVEYIDYDEYRTLVVFNKASLAHAFMHKLRVALKKSTRPGRLSKRTKKPISYHREIVWFDGKYWQILMECRLASSNMFRRTLFVARYIGVDSVPCVRIKRPRTT